LARDPSLFPQSLNSISLNFSSLPAGVGSGYWRVVGQVEERIDKPKEMAQRTLYGTGFAPVLSKI
jgi:hypothetical protein